MDANRLSGQKATALSTRTMLSPESSDGCYCPRHLVVRSRSRLRESLLLFKNSITTLMFAPISIPMAMLADGLRITHALWSLGDHPAAASQAPVGSRPREACACPSTRPCCDEGGTFEQAIETSAPAQRPIGAPKAAESALCLPRELAALDLYEAVFIPGDEMEFVGVVYDEATKQWRSTAMGSASPQLVRLRAREDRVLLVCSRSLLQALSLGGCGKSMLTVNDQKHGLVLQHQTLVNRLPRGYEVLGFQAGELSGLRLSSHDVFHILNLKGFLLHAAREAEAVTAASGGPFLKSWLIPLPDLLGIMDNTASQHTCKDGFWQLHSRGFASQVYLQLWDPAGWDASDSLEDIEISDATTWLETHGQEMDSATHGALMEAFAFLLEPPPLPPPSSSVSSGPKICIISHWSMTARTSLVKKRRDPIRWCAPPGPINPVLLGKTSPNIVTLSPPYHAGNEPTSAIPQRCPQMQHARPLLVPAASATESKPECLVATQDHKDYTGLMQHDDRNNDSADQNALPTTRPGQTDPSQSQQSSLKTARLHTKLAASENYSEQGRIGMHPTTGLCSGDRGVSHLPSSTVLDVMEPSEELACLGRRSCAEKITSLCIAGSDTTEGAQGQGPSLDKMRIAPQDGSGVSPAAPSALGAIQELPSPSVVVHPPTPCAIDSQAYVASPTHTSGFQLRQPPGPPAATSPAPTNPAAPDFEPSPSNSTSVDKSRDALETDVSSLAVSTEELSSPAIERVKSSSRPGRTRRRVHRTSPLPSPVPPPWFFTMSRAPTWLSDLTLSTQPYPDSAWAALGVDTASDRATDGSSPSPLSLQDPTIPGPPAGTQYHKTHTGGRTRGLPKATTLGESAGRSLVRHTEGIQVANKNQHIDRTRLEHGGTDLGIMSSAAGGDLIMDKLHVDQGDEGEPAVGKNGTHAARDCDLGVSEEAVKQAGTDPEQNGDAAQAT